MYRWKAGMQGEGLYKEGNPLEKGDERFSRKKGTSERTRKCPIKQYYPNLSIQDLCDLMLGTYVDLEFSFSFSSLISL